MSYTIKQLADLAGISVRTLHYYDQAGLLKPARVKNNGYRYYEENELLVLQQILFFRELNFPIKEIKRIIRAPGFDMRLALKDQKRLIELKKNRLNRLIKTIGKTINKITKETTMNDKDLYGSFSEEEMEQYTQEAKARWGDTDAYKESQKRYKKMTKDDLTRIQKEGDELMKEIAANMNKAAGSEKIQTLIGRHFNNLRHFYEPSLEMYRGLANMYIEDKRFAAYYEKYAPGLAQFMREAMIAYCDLAMVKK